MKEIITKYGVYFCITVILLSGMVLLYLYGHYNLSAPVGIGSVQKGAMRFAEAFTNPMPDPDQLATQIPENEEDEYLFPVYSLGDTCMEKNLLPSDVNRLCLKKDGTYQPLSNCQCEDREGNCEICYPPVNIDRKGRSTIYNADKLDEGTTGTTGASAGFTGTTGGFTASAGGFTGTTGGFTASAGFTGGFTGTTGGFTARGGFTGSPIGTTNPYYGYTGTTGLSK